MKLLDKFLNLLKLEPSPEQKRYQQQLKRESTKGEINSSISYDDIKKYDMKPFYLDRKIFHGRSWSYILLDNENLKIAYSLFNTINNLLLEYWGFFQSYTDMPRNIRTDFDILNQPISHIRLTPYTSTKRDCKYPLYLWISSYGEGEINYRYTIYIKQNGAIGKCDATLNAQNMEQISFQIQIRERNGQLYVRRIDRTRYTEPYGTEILYYDESK